MRQTDVLYINFKTKDGLEIRIQVSYIERMNATMTVHNIEDQFQNT